MSDSIYKFKGQPYPDRVQYKGEQIGQIILTDISINGNAIADPGCLKPLGTFHLYVAPHAYGVYVSQLIQYSIVASSL
jgi:hypothetical protein